jgi:hypothetical protein
VILYKLHCKIGVFLNLSKIIIIGVFLKFFFFFFLFFSFYISFSVVF